MYCYIAEALEAGYFVNYRACEYPIQCTMYIDTYTFTVGLTKEIEDLITLTIRQPPICSGSHPLIACILFSSFVFHISFLHLLDITNLRRIKNLLPENIEYWQIKMTIAIIMITTGFIRPGKELSPQLSSPSLPSSSSSSSSSLQVKYFKC